MRVYIAGYAYDDFSDVGLSIIAVCDSVTTAELALAEHDRTYPRGKRVPVSLLDSEEELSGHEKEYVIIPYDVREA